MFVDGTSPSTTDLLRPHVSSKSLLNLKSIVTHNVSSNSNAKIPVVERKSLAKPPPLPLAHSSSVVNESNEHSGEIDDKEKKRKKKHSPRSQSFPNRNVLLGGHLSKPNQLIVMANGRHSLPSEQRSKFDNNSAIHRDEQRELSGLSRQRNSLGNLHASIHQTRIVIPPVSMSETKPWYNVTEEQEDADCSPSGQQFEFESIEQSWTTNDPPPLGSSSSSRTVIADHSTYEQEPPSSRMSWSSPNNNERTVIPPLPLDSSMHFFGSSSYTNKPLASFPARTSNRINHDYLTFMRQIVESSTNDDIESRTNEIPIIRHPTLIPRTNLISPVTHDTEFNLKEPLVFTNSSLDQSTDSCASTISSDRTVSMVSCMSDHSNTNQSSVHKDNNENADQTLWRSNYETYQQQQTQPVRQHHRPSARCSQNFTRLPHPLRSQTLSTPTTPSGPLMFNGNFVRRPPPQFESVRTPVQQPEPEIPIPSELLDCCEASPSPDDSSDAVSIITETLEVATMTRGRISLSKHVHTQRNHHRRDSNLTTIEKNLDTQTAIRAKMNDVSERLTKPIGQMIRLPIVDTHCHFDLIFDRLHIKHNNIGKYFEDYNEFYPSNFSFDLAIQVFWRPKHLQKSKWTNWYSKYLDDERVYGSCGIHPHWSSAWKESCIEDIERCLAHPKVVAIGEIGLDFGPKNACQIDEQQRAFEAQLKLAAKWLKPIVIHSRDAYKLTFDLMKQYLSSDHKIHLHCFVGQMIDVHMFTSYFKEIKFGFTPIITRGNFLHNVIRQLDLTQILSETDSPYFVPEELSTLSRCAHPGMVYSVVEIVAQLRQMSVFDVARQLRENARQIYGV